jgi:hypothetical protein
MDADGQQQAQRVRQDVTLAANNLDTSKQRLFHVMRRDAVGFWGRAVSMVGCAVGGRGFVVCGFGAPQAPITPPPLAR